MNTAISAAHSDEAFYRNRQAMLVYPIIILPFLAALFWLGKGGKGERYLSEEAAVQKAGAHGFNANVPTAKNGSISGRDVDGPGYGKAPAGQLLSNFTNTRQDSATKGLKAIPATSPAEPATFTHESSLAGGPGVSVSPPAARSTRQSSNSGRIAGSSGRIKPGKSYYYNAPGNPSDVASASDQQLDRQLQQYQYNRTLPNSSGRSAQAALPSNSENPSAVTAQPASVRISDQVTASRLHGSSEPENPFLTAPTGGARTQPTQAVLSGGNYATKRVIAWMIPVVVHEDQTLRDGQQVKLRLLKEIKVDGVTVPANTILYAVCQLSDDRLRMSVRNLQLGSQLIPLDLDVYDTDGSAGVNVPGLSNNGQFGGQLRSSAIQGVQVPGVGSLGNTVLNSARMGAATAARQTTIRLKAGYNLFLKAQ